MSNRMFAVAVCSTAAFFVLGCHSNQSDFREKSMEQLLSESTYMFEALYSNSITERIPLQDIESMESYDDISCSYDNLVFNLRYITKTYPHVDIAYAMLGHCLLLTDTKQSIPYLKEYNKRNRDNLYTAQCLASYYIDEEDYSSA